MGKCHTRGMCHCAHAHVVIFVFFFGFATPQALVAKDAIFFSGHKFVGGPGTPGVLVVKKRLLCNAVPGTVGGGTVFFVTKNDHRYLRYLTHRRRHGGEGGERNGGAEFLSCLIRKRTLLRR